MYNVNYVEPDEEFEYNLSDELEIGDQESEIENYEYDIEDVDDDSDELEFDYESENEYELRREEEFAERLYEIMETSYGSAIDAEHDFENLLNEMEREYLFGFIKKAAKKIGSVIKKVGGSIGSAAKKIIAHPINVTRNFIKGVKKVGGVVKNLASNPLIRGLTGMIPGYGSIISSGLPAVSNILGGMEKTGSNAQSQIPQPHIPQMLGYPFPQMPMPQFPGFGPQTGFQMPQIPIPQYPCFGQPMPNLNQMFGKKLNPFKGFGSIANLMSKAGVSFEIPQSIDAKQQIAKDLVHLAKVVYRDIGKQFLNPKRRKLLENPSQREKIIDRIIVNAMVKSSLEGRPSFKKQKVVVQDKTSGQPIIAQKELSFLD